MQGEEWRCENWSSTFVSNGRHKSYRSVRTMFLQKAEMWVRTLL
jgi:hypothetical protein